MNTFVSKSFLLLILGFITALVFLAFYASPTTPTPPGGSKQRGIHLFGHGSTKVEQLKTLAEHHIEWVVDVPFGWQENHQSTQINFSHRGQGSWRKDAAIRQLAKEAHQLGQKVMVKPHIWLRNPTDKEWRGTIFFEKAADWEAWSSSYRDFILHYARLCEEMNIEALCIGTELYQTAVRRPDYWRGLIREIRSFYSGQLTYGANWDREYLEIPFWDELDFIGIQAYFPLSKKKNPEVGDLVKSWRKHLPPLQQISQKFNKPILFTEIGYKSTDDAAIAPWTWVKEVSMTESRSSFQTQANCYEAFFQVFWHQDWFAGAHFWEWRAGRERHAHQANINFSPQQKPASAVLKKWFANTGK